MLRILTLTWGLLVSLSIYAHDTVILQANSDQLVLGSHLDYLVDPDSTLSIHAAMQSPNWHQNRRDYPTFGYTRASYWAYINITDGSAAKMNRLLEIGYPVLNHVDVWIWSQGQLLQHYALGDSLPFAQRPYAHRNFVLPLTWSPGQSLGIVLRIRTQSAMQIPLTLWTSERFHQHDQTDLLLLGIYYGVIICMLLYNLFLFFSLRERSGAYYVVWVGGMLMFMMTLNGIAFQYLWPNSPAWNNQALVFFLGISVLFAILFTSEFLQLQTLKLSWIHTALKTLIILAILASAGAFLLPYTLGIHLSIGIAVLGIFCSFIIAFMRWRQGFSTARYYVLAWSFVMVGGAILAANKLGYIDRNLFTENATQMGSALEVLLLSFALGERVNQERKLREAAQHQAFVAQREANLELERKVDERTQELSEANRRLIEISVTDALTGISNRRHFDERLVLEIKRAQRGGYGLALLIIDIDHFKKVNDTYGHPAGDEVLRQVSKTLSLHVRRDTDTLARFGGEEFCVLLPNTDLQGLERVAAALRIQIEKLHIHLPHQPVLQITISLGGSHLPVVRHTEDGQTLLAAADSALYQAKHDGRNCFRFQPINSAS